MIRRLSIALRESGRAMGADARAIRVLAVSDGPEPALEFAANRDSLLPIDGVIGAGDLEPDYLGFLADAFRVPLLYVRGNHDRGGGWTERQTELPDPIDCSLHGLRGLSITGLSWPNERSPRAVHDDAAAWRQVASCYLRVRAHRPDIIVSHVPPLGLGDTPDDHYHRGFAAYRWLCDRLKPSLWVHGHTTVASVSALTLTDGDTTVVNASGAVLIELVPLAVARAAAASAGATIAAGRS